MRNTPTSSKRTAYRVAAGVSLTSSGLICGVCWPAFGSSSEHHRFSCHSHGRALRDHQTSTRHQASIRASLVRLRFEVALCFLLANWTLIELWLRRSDVIILRINRPSAMDPGGLNRARIHEGQLPNVAIQVLECRDECVVPWPETLFDLRIPDSRKPCCRKGPREERPYPMGPSAARCEK